MYILASFVKDKLSIGVWIYVWAFYFVPLIYISVFVPVPYCLDDCGSDHELLITKFRLKLKKAGKTARPFRYNLNQIPYDYTVEVRNRFKGLDLIECLMNHGRRLVTLYRRQGSRPSQRKRNEKKQNGCLERPYK